jgi:GMP synthase-like glutamine amidotransferase
MEALMNRRPRISAADEAFIWKWRWCIAFCYSAILLFIVLGAVVRPHSSADQGFSSASITAGEPHLR